MGPREVLTNSAEGFIRTRSAAPIRPRELWPAALVALLADADVKVIYRQDRSALQVTTSEMELSDRERALVRSLPKGTGLWRLGDSSFEVKNELTRAELPLFNTDERMDQAKDQEAGHAA